MPRADVPVCKSVNLSVCVFCNVYKENVEKSRKRAVPTHKPQKINISATEKINRKAKSAPEGETKGKGTFNITEKKSKNK